MNQPHRLNHCKKWKETNMYDCDHKVNFVDIFSDGKEKYMSVVYAIMKNWNLKNGKNEMMSLTKV